MEKTLIKTPLLAEAERLKMIRLSHKLTQEQMAKVLGISQPNYNRYEKKGVPYGIASVMVAKIVERFPDISLEWLRDGIGEMTKTSSLKIDGIGNLKTIKLPYAGNLASASFNNNSDILSNFTSYMEITKIPGVDYNGRIAVTINGRSMEPTIMDGATVLIKPIEKEDIKSGVFLIDYHDEIVCKRILDNDMSDGYLSIHSDNPKAGTQKVYAAEIRKVYKVERIINSIIE